MTSKGSQGVGIAVAVSLGCAAAGAAPVARAQDDPGQTPGLAGLPALQGLPGLQDLPGILTPHASFGVSAEARYDSNVARTDAATALIRGLVRDDTLTTPRVVIDLATLLGRANLFVQGATGYEFHQNNRQLDRQTTDLKGGATFQIGRCSSAVIGGYAARQSDLENLSSSVQRNLAVNKSVEMDLGCLRPSGLSPKIAVSRSWLTNSAGAQSNADTDITSVTPTLSYARPGLGVVSVYGRYDDIRYPNRVDLSGRTAGFDGAAGGIDVSHPVTAKLFADLNVSYVQLTPKQAGTTRFSGINYDTAFVYAPTTRTTLKLDVGRTVKPSIRIDSNFTVTDFMTLSGKMKLGYRTSVELGVDRKRETYGRNPLVLTGFLASDTLSEIYATMNFKVNRHVLLTLDARDQKRDANPAAFAYTDWRVGLTAAVTY